MSFWKRHDDRAVVRRDGADDADRLVAPDAQAPPGLGPARRPATGFASSSAMREVQVDGVPGERDSRGELGHLGEERRVVPPSATMVATSGSLHRLEVVEEGVQDLRPVPVQRQVGPDALVEAPPGLGDGALDLLRAA